MTRNKRKPFSSIFPHFYSFSLIFLHFCPFHFIFDRFSRCLFSQMLRKKWVSPDRQEELHLLFYHHFTSTYFISIFRRFAPFAKETKHFASFALGATHSIRFPTTFTHFHWFSSIFSPILTHFHPFSLIFIHFSFIF